MADIKTSRSHSLDPSKLRRQLETLASEMNRKFGIQSDFEGNAAHLSGSAIKEGAVTWTSDTLTVELTLDFMGKMFKNKIEKEIEARMDAMVA